MYARNRTFRFCEERNSCSYFTSSLIKNFVYKDNTGYRISSKKRRSVLSKSTFKVRRSLEDDKYIVSRLENELKLYTMFSCPK